MQAETEEKLRTEARARAAKAGHNPHKPARLKKPREFQRVRQEGRSLGTGLLTLGWAPNGLAWCRCGYTVGKRVGGAVTRNRVKRRLREIIRLQLKANQIASGYDLVFIARTGAAQATYQELATDVVHLLQRARLWRAASPEGFVPL
jgi:ribonuclease P protein component